MATGPTGVSLDYITINNECIISQYYSNGVNKNVKILNPFSTGCVGPTGIGIEDIIINSCGDIDGYYSNGKIKRFGKIVATGNTGMTGIQGPTGISITGPTGNVGNKGDTGATGNITNYTYTGIDGGYYFIPNDIDYSQVIDNFRTPYEYNTSTEFYYNTVFGMEPISISFTSQCVILTPNSYLNDNIVNVYAPYSDSSIAMGNLQFYNQGLGSIALGFDSGTTTQGNYTIAIGNSCGSDTQADEGIAIGSDSGAYTQGSSAIAIGYGTAYETQGINAIAIGNYAGYLSQGENTIAISNNSLDISNFGLGAGAYFQGTYGVAIGRHAGLYFPANKSIAIGNLAGEIYLGDSSISIGYDTSSESANQCVNIGYKTGFIDQQNFTIAIGYQSGFQAQSQESIAIGNNTGVENQNFGSIAIGTYSGTYDQNETSIAIGLFSGHSNQDYDAIAIGNAAGYQNQANNSIAIGRYAGEYNQDDSTIIIGANSGSFISTQSIVIGHDSGNSIDKNIIVLGFNPNPIIGIQDAFFTIPELLPCNFGSQLIYDVGTGQIGPFTSSKRFKDNIETISDDYINNIEHLQVKRFDKDRTSCIGLIAEEVFEYYPEIVNLDENEEPYSINYSLLNVILLKQLQLILKTLNK